MSNQNVEYARSQIAKAYPGFVWEDRVKKMSNRQVMAIYYRMLETTPDIFTKGRFAYAPKEKEQYHQMTIFEYNLERRLEDERKGIIEQFYD